MTRITRYVTATLALGLSACTNPYDPVQRAIGGGLIRASSQSRPAIKRGEPAREAGEDRGRRPNYAAQKERKPRPPFVAKPAAKYLEQRIRIGECGKDQPELGIAEAE